ncbi:MAG: N-acetyl sugar amidotransferase [Hydrotalea sp.]|nr:N-acetyl sugar amidotransferase [Hydrotalea sp.]
MKKEFSTMYRICSNCIMDTTAPGISFDKDGKCEYCQNFYNNILPNWRTDQSGWDAIMKIVNQIKEEGKNKEYDCLMGISGGVDSSYMAYLAKVKFGLRPLIFHIDAGWNSQQAVNNIERIIDKLGLDLHTEVINWEEMKDLQASFFKAQVCHIDTPQDHAFVAALYNFAAKHGFKYILNGGNISSECVREPLEWHYHASDLRQIRDIHKKFGTIPLKTFPFANIFKYRIYYKYVKGIKVIKPLDFIPFEKEKAMQFLETEFGWQRYAQKHYESRFTRFYEGYWMPAKFGYDIRKAHYSSLILTGQMTREDALEKIKTKPIDDETAKADFEYVATKLGFSVEEFQSIFEGQNKSYRDYKNNMFFIDLAIRVMRFLGLERKIIK